MNKSTTPRINFKTFYATAYKSDHRHPVNLALHMFGTFSGLSLLAVAFTIWPFWTALAFPIVHAFPGLIGHRLFDRDEALGDIRLTRTDFPLWWFPIANHIMTAQVITGRWKQ